MNDSQKIEYLYGSISKLNFFNIDYLKEEFDWDKFFKSSSDIIMFNTLIENIELVNTEEKTNYKKEEYRIETSMGKRFNLFITYQGKNKNDIFILNGIEQNIQKDSPEAVQYFKDLQERLPDDSYFCYLRFEDEKKRTNLTGEVGSDALELFSSLKATVLQSFAKNPDFSQSLYGIIMLVAKTEEAQRLPLYGRLLKRETPSFGKILIDKNSDRDYTYLIATK